MPIRRLLIIVLLWCAGLGAATQFAKMAVPFAEILSLFPDEKSKVGWLLSSISLVGALLGLLAGDLVARFGARLTLVIGLVLGGVLSLLQGVGLDFSALLFSRIAEGLSHLLIVVAAPTLITQIAGPKLQAQAMALWATFFGVSFALVGLFGLPLVEQHGPHALFLAHGCVMLLLAGALMPMLRQTPFAHSSKPQRNEKRQPFTIKAQFQAFRSARICGPGAGWLFYTLTFVSLLAVLPTQIPADQRQQIVTLMPLLSIAVSLLVAPFLFRAASAMAAVILGYAAALISLSTFTLGVPIQLIALLMFAAFGLVQSGTFACVAEWNHNEKDRSLAFGVVAQTGNLGNLLGTPLLHTITTAHGTNVMLTAVAIIYGLAIATYIILNALRTAQAANP